MSALRGAAAFDWPEPITTTQQQCQEDSGEQSRAQHSALHSSRVTKQEVRRLYSPFVRILNTTLFGAFHRTLQDTQSATKDQERVQGGNIRRKILSKPGHNWVNFTSERH